MTQRRSGDSGRIQRSTPPEGLSARYEAPEASQGAFQNVEKCAGAALEAPWRADARQSPHKQAEIQATSVDQEALADVGVFPQMHSSQTPGLVEVRVGSLEAFAALAQQPSAAEPPDSPPMGMHGVPVGAIAAPASPATVRLRHAAAQSQLGQRDHRLVAVIPLCPRPPRPRFHRPATPLRPAPPP